MLVKFTSYDNTSNFLLLESIDSNSEGLTAHLRRVLESASLSSTDRRQALKGNNEDFFFF